MVHCCIIGCKSRSERKAENITFHSFPKKSAVRQLWIRATGRPNWEPTKYTRICSRHFEQNCFRQTQNKTYLNESSLPTLHIVELSHVISSDITTSDQEVKNPSSATSVSEMDTKTFGIPLMEKLSTSAEAMDLKMSSLRQEEIQAQAQPQPGPSRTPCTKTSDTNVLSETPQDPLSKAIIEQCRFCGEFGKTCIPVSKMHLSNNRTTLAVNDYIVQLDFNDDSLPKTVCRDCDVKLKEMYKFVQVVKTAQNNLVKVGAFDIEEEKLENDNNEEIETVVVKAEYDNDSDENDDDGESGNEDKDGIADSVTVGETVFIKEAVPQKRKSNTVTANEPKKAKSTESKSENEYTELIIDIKEEVIEREETNDDANNIGCSISDTGTDDKPSEVELATSTLIYEMRRDSTDGFS